MTLTELFPTHLTYENRGGEVICPDPAVIHHDVEDLPHYTTRFTGNQVEVKFDNPQSASVISTTGDVSITFRKTMSRNAHHDVPLSRWVPSTDVRLSTIAELGDRADSFTPDAIQETEDHFMVLEIATERGGTIASLNRVFETKKVSYYDALSARAGVVGKDVLFLIIVVSPAAILCNFELSDEDATTINRAFRMMQAIDASIVSQTGESWFYDFDLNPQLMEVLRRFQMDPVWTDVFDEEFYNLCMVTVNESRRHQEGDVSIQEKWNAERALFKDSTLGRAVTFYKDRIMSKVSSLGEWEDYKTKQRIHGTTTRQSKVTVFPFYVGDKEISPSMSTYCRYPTLEEGMTEQEEAHVNLWQEALSSCEIHDYLGNECDVEEATRKAMLETESSDQDKKDRARRFRVTVNLDDKTKEVLSLKGIGGKRMASNQQNQYHRRERQVGIDPETDVGDISKFMELDLMEETGHVCGGETRVLEDSAEGIAPGKHDLVRQIVRWYDESLWGKALEFVSHLCVELIISAAQNCKKNQYILKKLKFYNVWLLLKPTNSSSHIFFSLATPSGNFDKSFPRVFNAGFEVDGWTYTTFQSMKLDKLDQMVKAYSLGGALFSHYVASRGFDLTQNSIELFEEMKKDVHLRGLLNCTYITMLEGKSQTEEVITLSRYAYMESMTGGCHVSNPGKVIKKFPTPIRSRLQLWWMRTLVDRCQKMEGLRGAQDCVPSLVSGVHVPVEQIVDEFYIGYVCSKNLMAEKNKAISMAQKIVEYELKFRNNPRHKDIHKSEPSGRPDWHEYSPTFIKHLSLFMRKKLQDTLGPQWMVSLREQILISLRNISFEEIATLKASGKFFGQDRVLGSYEDLQKWLEDSGVGHKRPKVTEGLVSLVDRLKAAGVHVEEAGDLVKPCLEMLEAQGHIFVDLFKKPQHGGLREIYVLEIAARIVQVYLERIGKTMCGLFSSEIMTHPALKYKTPIKHGVTLKKIGGEFVTLSKAADASKWNQAHFVAKFAQFMIGVTPSEFHGFIFRAMSLWHKKRIMMPVELVEQFLKNKDNESGNPMYEYLRSSFLGKSDDDRIVQPGFVHMDVKSGMMQGILHYTSSLLHTSLQMMCKDLFHSYFSSRFDEPIFIDIQQSSDDSSLMFSFRAEGPITRKQACVGVMMQWKDELGLLAGIFPSLEKTTDELSLCSEFNSEWFFHEKWVRPTVRWVAASMSLSVVESQSERMEEFDNLLKDTLEAGSTTLSCACIQRFQLRLHYLMLGSSVNILFPSYSLHLRECPDPSLGFFPLTPPTLAGVAGFRFNYYLCSKSYKLSSRIKKWLMSKDAAHLGLTTRLGTLIRGVSIRFGNHKLFKGFFRSLNPPDDWRELINSNPQLMFLPYVNNWEDSKLRILAKCSAPGVVASLSNYSPVARLIAAAVYCINSNVVHLGHGISDLDKSKARSLLYLVVEAEREEVEQPEFDGLDWADQVQLEVNKDSPLSEDQIKMMFPLHQQYEDLLAIQKELSKGFLLREEEIKVRSRSQVQVFEQILGYSHPLEKLCLAKWWNRVDLLPMSSRAFDALWEKKKQLYAWLKDTYDETKDELGLNSAIEVHSLVSRLVSKERKLFLTTTAAKGGATLPGTLSRIHWPNMKIVTPDSLVSLDLRSTRGIASAVASLAQLPLSEQKVGGLIESLARGAPSFLRSGSSTLPPRLVPLHVILKFAAGLYVTPGSLVADVLEARAGVLGHWDQAQRFDNSTGKVVWSGRGVWLGTVADLGVRIEFEDMVVVGLEVTSLADLEQNSNNCQTLLNSLMKELCKGLTLPKGQAKLRYSWQKKGVNIDRVGVPIVERRMFRTVPKVYLRELKVKLTRYALRLVISQDSREVSILQFHVKDSDFRGIHVDGLPDDPWLSSWVEMEPMDTSDFLGWINSVKEASDRFERFRGGLPKTVGVWELRELKRMVRLRIISQISRTFSISMLLPEPVDEDPFFSDTNYDEEYPSIGEEIADNDELALIFSIPGQTQDLILGAEEIYNFSTMRDDMPSRTQVYLNPVLSRVIDDWGKAWGREAMVALADGKLAINIQGEVKQILRWLWDDLEDVNLLSSHFSIPTFEMEAEDME